jgi:hypothetical protein
MSKLRVLTVFALLFGAFGAAGADTLKMEGTEAGQDPMRPTRGMTAASVESRFGAPEAKVAAVGDPPISRWEYKDFIVYFEYDRVIHAVRKHGQPG